jgi:hypothetical protein
MLEPPDEAVYQLIVPADAVALNIVEPETQIFPGVVAVIVGIVLTVALVVPAALVQLFTVIVTELMPVAAVVAFAMLGVCDVLLKLFGPVHA